MNKRVLISGGSGLVGSRLTELLQAKGYEVAHLSRSASDGKVKTIPWDVENMQLDAAEIEGYDSIIHLAGAGIVDEPWTEKRKQIIQESRIKTAELLKQAIEQNTKKPEVVVSASAVGYYGFVTTDHIFTEQEEPGNDFLADTCVQWERSVESIAKLGIPTSKIRIGIVLSKDGGALKEMANPVKFNVGAPLGSGKQYMPWIHIDDLCRIFIYALENKLEGAFNAGAPNQVDNKTFTNTLASVLKKPLWLPNVPAFVMKLILGKRSLLVLEGSRVSCKKIQDRGFEFKFKDLKEALKKIYH
ncbi:MAG: TIGR01777 family oxidoreductase [Vicingaceae bacterium]